MRNRVELADLRTMQDEIRERSCGYNRARDRDRRNAGVAAGPPAIFSFGQGMVLWLDSDYSGGVADGSTSPAPVNRVAGSNAVVGITPGAGTITWRAAAWRGPRVQSCWTLSARSFRATGSDIVNAANGLGKNWTIIAAKCLRFLPLSAPNSVAYMTGWDKLAAASFSQSFGMARMNNARYTYGVFNPTGSGETFVDTQIVHQAAMVWEQQRLGGNQIQYAVNKVQTAAQAYASGVTADVDGLSIGGWAGNNVGNAGGDYDLRTVMVWNRNLTMPERDTVYSYCFGPAGIYSGFEVFSSLGAT